VHSTKYCTIEDVARCDTKRAPAPAKFKISPRRLVPFGHCQNEMIRRFPLESPGKHKPSQRPVQRRIKQLEAAQKHLSTDKPPIGSQRLVLPAEVRSRDENIWMTRRSLSDGTDAHMSTNDDRSDWNSDQSSWPPSWRAYERNSKDRDDNMTEKRQKANVQSSGSVLTPRSVNGNLGGQFENTKRTAVNLSTADADVMPFDEDENQIDASINSMDQLSPSVVTSRSTGASHSTEVVTKLLNSMWEETLQDSFHSSGSAFESEMNHQQNSTTSELEDHTVGDVQREKTKDSNENSSSSIKIEGDEGPTFDETAEKLTQQALEELAEDRETISRLLNGQQQDQFDPVNQPEPIHDTSDSTMGRPRFQHMSASGNRMLADSSHKEGGTFLKLSTISDASLCTTTIPTAELLASFRGRHCTQPRQPLVKENHSESKQNDYPNRVQSGHSLQQPSKPDHGYWASISAAPKFGSFDSMSAINQTNAQQQLPSNEKLSTSEFREQLQNSRYLARNPELYARYVENHRDRAPPLEHSIRSTPIVPQHEDIYSVPSSAYTQGNGNHPPSQPVQEYRHDASLDHSIRHTPTVAQHQDIYSMSSSVHAQGNGSQMPSQPVQEYTHERCSVVSDLSESRAGNYPSTSVLHPSGTTGQYQDHLEILHSDSIQTTCSNSKQQDAAHPHVVEELSFSKAGSVKGDTKRINRADETETGTFVSGFTTRIDDETKAPGTGCSIICGDFDFHIKGFLGLC